MKSKRMFLENQKDSDSYVKSTVDKDDGYLSLKLSDCDRRIEWFFGRPGDKRAIAKITKVKKFIDEAYAHLTKEQQ